MKTALFLIAFALTVSAFAAPQNVPSTTTNPPPSIDALVKTIINKNSTSEVKMAAWQRVFSLPVGLRDEALRSVIKSDNCEEIVTAIRMSFRFGRPKIGALIAANITKWDELAQANALSCMSSAVSVRLREPEFWDAARQILRAFVDKGEKRNRQQFERILVGHDKKNKVTISDEAAMLLQYSGEAEDRYLIQEAVALDPQSSALWLALSSYGKLRPQETALAQEVLRTNELPEFNHVCAAVALGRSSPEFVAFALQKIREVVRTLGSKDTPKMTLEMGKAWGSTNEKEHQKLGQMVTHMMSQMQTLVALRFLHSPEAEELIFSTATAREFRVRDFGALVAAERYPVRFLKILGRKRYPNEFENLCGRIAIWHPNLKSQLLNKLPAAKLDAAIKRLQGEMIG